MCCFAYFKQILTNRTWIILLLNCNSICNLSVSLSRSSILWTLILPQHIPACGHRAWEFLILLLLAAGSTAEPSAATGSTETALLSVPRLLSHNLTSTEKEQTEENEAAWTEQRETGEKKPKQKQWLENKRCAEREAGDRGRRQTEDEKGHLINTNMSFHNDREGWTDTQQRQRKWKGTRESETFRVVSKAL